MATILRCPCRSNEQLSLSEAEKEAWVQCKVCNAWQHAVCVGLLDDEEHMPEHYFCEQCKPEHHERFPYGPGPYSRVGIARQRQAMFVMPPVKTDAERKKKTKWLVDEIMAIVKGHPQALGNAWNRFNNLGPGTLMDQNFYPEMVLSVRIVLNNATIPALQDFRAGLVKVRFSEKEVVADELVKLRTWLDEQFMTKIESVTMKTWLEEKFKTQGRDGTKETTGQAYAKLVRKCFNLPGQEVIDWGKIKQDT